MMHLLERPDFDRVLPLVRQGEIRSHMAYVHAVLEGNQEGKVFVDNLREPRMALVCPASGFSFAFGTPDTAALRAFLPELIAKHLVDKCLLFATSRAWRAALNLLLPRRTSRIGFEFRPSSRTRLPDWRERVPFGFTLEPMTAERVGDWPPGLDPWVIRIHGGWPDFAAISFGHGIFQGKRMVSFSAAGAIGGGEAEVEVGTAVEFRCRGLARLACRAFIAECRSRRLTPAWNCAQHNVASAVLGRRLGFMPIEQIHGFPLEPGMPLADGER